jgi:hypothetical protein
MNYMGIYTVDKLEGMYVKVWFLFFFMKKNSEYIMQYRCRILKN